MIANALHGINGVSCLGLIILAVVGLVAWVKLTSPSVPEMVRDAARYPAPRADDVDWRDE